MKKVISVTEFSRGFSDIMGRVYYMQEEYEIKKGNNIVAKIVPSNVNTINAKDFKEFLLIGPHLSDEEAIELQKDIETIRGNAQARDIELWD